MFFAGRPNENLLCLSKNKGELLMEQIKQAITNLEQSVLRLESAVHAAKKNTSRATEEIATLKTVIRQTHERIDKALARYQQKGEA